MVLHGDGMVISLTCCR